MLYKTILKLVIHILYHYNIAFHHFLLRYDTLLPQDIIIVYFCQRDNFYFYFLSFFFRGKKKKKTLKLTRWPPYHMDKVVESCVLRWQKIISLFYFVISSYYIWICFALIPWATKHSMVLLTYFIFYHKYFTSKIAVILKKIM
jgi:hypothetical protein